MATLSDIAHELGISKSTVSKALNGADDVSQAMRHAVLEKAVEMGYTRGFRTGNSPRIALFINNMEYETPADFGYDIVLGFRKAAEPEGYQVDLIPLDLELQNDIHYDTYMMMYNYCAGLFLGITLLDPWIHEFSDCKTPTVLYDNHISGNPHVAHVGIDNAEGMELAVRYLRSLGHEKIGYLGSALTSYVYRQRYRAFLQALQDNGLPADRSMTGAAQHISECLTQHLPRLLNQGCTAIVCSHDVLASSVLIHCSELGLHVPRDVSILGFDDIPLCQYTTPPLSTMRQNRTELGKSAFHALTSLLNQIPIATLLLHPELIPRNSTAPVHTGAPE